MIDQNLIRKASQILHDGGLVAMPTETVYGLGADATNPEAVAKIFAAKERPADHPLIVHLADISQLSDWACDVSPDAKKLAEAFWPGPLTMIFKKQPNVLDAVTGGQSTVGVRVPNHPVAQALLREFDGGIAAPSANKFTHISPTTAAAVQEELGDQVDLILDGGDCEVGLESTIIDMSGRQPVILRPGMITLEEISQVLSVPVTMRRQDTPTDVRTPGMHHLHYAPTTPVRVVSTQELLACLVMQEQPVAVMAYSEVAITKAEIKHVVMPVDARQYAHDLYHVLRELDHLQLHGIMIEAVPDAPEWEAIRDRLQRAAGSR